MASSDKKEQAEQAETPEQADERMVSSPETLTGDITEVIKQELQALPDVWQKLSQESQDEVLARVKVRARALAGEAVRMAHGVPLESVTGELDQVVFKDGAKLVVKTLNVPGATAFASLAGNQVQVCAFDAEAMGAGYEPQEGEPDQHDAFNPNQSNQPN